MKTEPRTPLRQWLDWQPKDGITADSPSGEPTKPSKPSFVGFVGSLQGDSPKIGVAEESPAPDNRPEDRIHAAVDSSPTTERVMSWAEWKAAALNRLFLEQGTSEQAGPDYSRNDFARRANVPRDTATTGRKGGPVAMGVYKRGRVWWYRFTWKGEVFRESTKHTNKRIAEQIEAAHKTSLAKGEVGIRDRKPAATIRQFATGDFLPFCRSTFAAKVKTLSYYENGTARLLEYSAVANESLDTITSEAITGYARLPQRGWHENHYRQPRAPSVAANVHVGDRMAEGGKSTAQSTDASGRSASRSRRFGLRRKSLFRCSATHRFQRTRDVRTRA